MPRVYQIYCYTQIKWTGLERVLTAKFSTLCRSPAIDHYCISVQIQLAVGPRVTTVLQLLATSESYVNTEICCSPTFSFLQSEQSRGYSYVCALHSRIVGFADRDFSGIATGEIGHVSPNFSQRPFWDSSKSDEKSVTLFDGGTIPLTLDKPAHVWLVFLYG